MSEVDVSAPEADRETVDAVEVESHEAEQVEGEESSSEKPKETSKERRERQKQAVERLRSELAQTKAAAEAAEERRRKIVEAGQREQPPKENDFTDYAEYVAARAVYASDRRLAERQAQELEAEATTARQRATEIEGKERSEVAQNWAAQVSAAKTRYTDFEAVVYAADVHIPQHVAEQLVALDDGPDIAYHLATHKAEAADIARMKPTDAAYALGRLSARLAVPSPRTQTNAPPPIAPVRGGAGVATDPARMPFNDYVKWREKGGKP